jgi:BTB And C-terminal Kelch
LNANNAAAKVRGILIVAKYLIMDNVTEACETFLPSKEQLNHSTCVGMWRFARKYGCLQLTSDGATLIAKNLAAVNNQPEFFFDLSLEELGKLLLCEAIITDAADDERCHVWLPLHG